MSQKLTRKALHATIDAERARGDRLVEENQRLQKELDQVKLELKLERQNKFATNMQKQDSGDTAGAKQKCLFHLARTARDWQKLTTADSADFRFFAAIREFVRNGCEFHRLRHNGELTETQQTTQKIWLRERLQQLIAFPVTHEKAVTLQKRILRHQHEWLVFLDDARVPPTNNMAERALRPLVLLRKITFGHRSHAGAVRMGRLMTVAETAKRHGHRPSDIYYRYFTQPPGRVLRQLYNDS